MKNILLGLLLLSTSTIFAGTNADKCSEDTKTKVHFKLTHDRKNDVVTKTGKNISINVDVNNTSGAGVTVKMDFFADGKLVQSITTPATLAAGAKTTISNKLNLSKGKKIDNLTVTIKNVDCSDIKLNTQTLLSTNNDGVKTALNEIGF